MLDDLKWASQDLKNFDCEFTMFGAEYSIYENLLNAMPSQNEMEPRLILNLLLNKTSFFHRHFGLAEDRSILVQFRVTNDEEKADFIFVPLGLNCVRGWFRERKLLMQRVLEHIRTNHSQSFQRRSSKNYVWTLTHDVRFEKAKYCTKVYMYSNEKKAY